MAQVNARDAFAIHPGNLNTTKKTPFPPSFRTRKPMEVVLSYEEEDETALSLLLEAQQGSRFGRLAFSTLHKLWTKLLLGQNQTVNFCFHYFCPVDQSRIILELSISRVNPLRSEVFFLRGLTSRASELLCFRGPYPRNTLLRRTLSSKYFISEDFSPKRVALLRRTLPLNDFASRDLTPRLTLLFKLLPL